MVWWSMGMKPGAVHVTCYLELWTLTFTQNCSKSEEGEYVYLRINFFHPGRSAEVSPLPYWVALSDSSTLSLSLSFQLNGPGWWSCLPKPRGNVCEGSVSLTFQVHFGLCTLDSPFLYSLLRFLHSSFRAGSKHGSGAGSGLVHVFNLIKDVQKRFKTREQEKKEMEVGGSDTHSILASFPGLSSVCCLQYGICNSKLYPNFIL